MTDAPLSSSPAPPAGAGSPGRSRGRQSALDMVRSLAVIGATVAVVVLLVPRPDARVQQPVDVAGAATAQPQASFELVVPDVPAGWTPTSARFRPDGADDVPTWHIGYLTTDERYAALEVADAATPRWLDEQTGDAEPAETLEIAGEPWQVLRSDDPRRTSLVLEESGVTTVVTGSAVVDELVELVEATVAARS